MNVEGKQTSFGTGDRDRSVPERQIAPSLRRIARKQIPSVRFVTRRAHAAQRKTKPAWWSATILTSNLTTGLPKLPGSVGVR
jgi:hypothetical protein